MALLDGYFSPQTYGGQGGGLLDLLRMSQQQNTQYQPSPGFEDGSYMQGQTRVPVFGQPQATGEATLPPNATPTTGYGAPQPVQQPNHFGSALQGFADNLHTGPIGALVGGISGLVKGTTPENQTVKALVSRGLDADTAKVIAQDPGLLRSVLPQVMGIGKDTDDIREYKFTVDQETRAGRKPPSFTEFMQRKRAVSGEFGLTPIWGTGPDGKPAFIQPGKSGQAVLGQMPEGFQIARDPIKLDGGTEWILLDPQTRQPVGRQSKNLAESASQREQGEATGKAVASAPADIQAGQNALDYLDKIKKHEFINRGTGFTGWAANWVPGTGGYDFQNLVDQAKSGAFLTAIQQMRGMGSLSNAEGDTATKAVNRMNTATSKEAFLDALADYERVVRQGVGNAQRRLGGTQAAAPVGGVDLKKKYGLD